MQKNITIAFDIDGVIRDIDTKKITKGCLKALKWFENKGYKIIITTASDEDMEKWLKRNKINYPLYKIPKATIYFNDRAIRFINWHDATSYL